MNRAIAGALMLALVAVPVAVAASSNAVDVAAPTFYRDVLPVLQENCQTCHRPGGANLGGMVAPMAFTEYQETRPWAKSIARQVEARTMPPWHASPQHAGVFANERTLDETQIATLVSWAKAGAPAGDVAEAPLAREWPQNDGWSIGKPDLVLDMGQQYFVDDDVEDKYVTFVTEITKDQLPEPRWLKAVEFRPGSPVVHHIIARPLGGIAPGNDPTVYNDGFGTLIEPGTQISWQMHYHKEPGPGTGSWDRSSAALRFYPAGYQPEHVVANESLGKTDFEIPPGDANYTAVTTTTFERESLLMGYTPHMHLRGKSARYVAKYPDGTEEVLLEVPRYDFNWQTHYEYPSPGKRIPAGTQIELTMSWDNSMANPSNPDPTAAVRFGQPTTAEMMFGFVAYTDAEPGYVPQGSWLNNRNADPGRLKHLLKERFGLDWDTMTPEERGQVLERMRRESRSESRSQGRVGSVDGD